MTVKRSVGPMQRINRYPAQVISRSEIRWRKEKPGDADVSSLSSSPGTAWTDGSTKSILRVLDPFDDFRQGGLVAVHEDSDPVDTPAENQQSIDRRQQHPNGQRDLPRRY